MDQVNTKSKDDDHLEDRKMIWNAMMMMVVVMTMMAMMAAMMMMVVIG